MPVGDLGTIQVGPHHMPNPIGIAIPVNDMELIQAMLESQELTALTDNPLALFIELSEQDIDNLSPNAQLVYEKVTTVARTIAIKKFRDILQLAGFDIADRPESCEPGMTYPGYTNFHIVAAIVPLPDKKAPDGPLTTE